MTKLLLMNMPSAIDVYSKSRLKAAIAPRPFVSMAELAASVLETKNQVEILDLQFSLQPFKDIYRKIKNYDPDMIGMTFTTPLIGEAKKVSSFIKERFPEITQIAGGVHPSIMPEEVLKETDIDIAVIGEGDLTLKELVKKKPLTKIRGIAYKDKAKNKISIKKRKKEKNEIRRNKPRPFIKNLDSLPLPAWHLFPIKKYRNPRMMARKNPVGTIMTSRGCIFNCVFCNKSVYGRQFRAKSAERVVKEFLHLKKSGFNEIHIWDDMFSTDLKRAKKICKELIKEKTRITWQLECGVRVNCVDQEFFNLARKAGCYKVAFGYESGNGQILKNMNKGATLEQARKATQMAKKAGLEITGFFMLGLPGETIQTMNDTIKFAQQLNPNYAKATILVPFPSTIIFDKWNKEGLIKSTDWNKYNFHTASRIYDHPNLDWDTLERYYNLFYKKFYFRPRYLLKRFFRSLIRGELLYDMYYAIKTFS